MRRIQLVVLLCGILVALPSSASIIFEAGGGGTGNNILLQGTQTGLTIFGVLNTPENEAVGFTGNVVISGQTSAGQARITSEADWTQLTIFFPEFTTNEIIFRVTPTTDAQVTVEAWDSENEYFISAPFDIGSPSGGFLKAVGVDGQTISRLTIGSSAPLAEVLQVRVGDLFTGENGVVVPEPASVAFIGGGLLVFGLFARRRTRNRA